MSAGVATHPVASGHDHADHGIHQEDSHVAHSHGEPSFDWEWGEFWSLMGSLEHWAFEVISDFVVWVVFSLVLYRFVYKAVLEPRLRDRIHREIDAEHGVEHDDCEGKVEESEMVPTNDASTK